MFKKKKEAEKQARLAQRAEVEERFAAEIAAVEKMPDPAKQVLKLAEIEQKASQYIEDNTLVSNPALDNLLRIIGISSAGNLAVGIPMMIIAPHVAAVAGLSAIAAGGLGTTSLDVAFSQRKFKGRQAEVAGHLSNMSAFLTQAREMKQSLVENDADKIAQSPFYERVLSLRGLSGAFDGAAAKQVEKLKREAEEAHKATQRRQRDAAPQPSLDRYDHLKDPFGYKK